jgi:hypothetical protein
MNAELKMAMRLAATSWPGTSILDGAMHILAEVYGPHEHIFEPDHDGKERCTRCGVSR